MKILLLFDTIQQESKETEPVLVLTGTGDGIMLAAAVREDAQKSCSWDLLTDGTGSDSRPWISFSPRNLLNQ